MDASIINLLVQIPLVGVFVWFTLRLVDVQRQERAQRDEEWRQWLRSEHQDFQQFLREERTTRDEAFARSFGRLAEEVKGLGLELGKHDARAESGIEEIVKAIREGQSE